jgi:predicted CXXCH cytochrome family protein
VIFRSSLILCPALLLTAQDAGVTNIHSPAAGSVWTGAVRIIARVDAGQKLLLDGNPVEAAAPAPGVALASMKLAAGAHEISLGAEKVRFHVGAGAPAGFAPFREHPPVAAGCDSCHAVKEGAWALKRASLSGICFQCHDREAFPKAHTHVYGTLADCQMCHNPHGSAAAGHMKMTKAKACTLCHSQINPQ